MKTDKHYTAIVALLEIDLESISEARRKFFAYKEKGIVEKGLFDDESWILSDEKNRFGFDFSVQADAFRTFSGIMNISPKKFEEYLKVFIVNNMGMLSLGTLQHIILSIKRTAYTIDNELMVNLVQADTVWASYVEDFFSIIPRAGREDAIEELLEQCEKAIDRTCFTGDGAQRSLATFESYFRFHDILKRFWTECNDVDEKLFYFPVWLWWNITGILPTRPHEFALIPRNCLEESNGKHFIALRKNRTKGTNKTKGYRIEEDYQTVKYQIPDALASEIQWYIDKTADCLDTDIHTLLVTETHYHKWDRSVPYTSRYFTYTNLNTCLRYFYKNIIEGKYGYYVLMEKTHTVLPNERTIEYIHLGDTRHIALINLIAEGASPVTAMVLAGHDNPEMSAHYYSNISTLIECRVHRQYKKMLNGDQTYALSVPRAELKVGESIPCAYNGYCYSERTRNNDFSECYKVTGPSGEMGYCPNCDYFRNTSDGFHKADEKYTNRIASEGRMLAQIVRQVRAGRGDTEDIVNILNRLNSTAYSYERYLREKMEDNNVET